MDGNNQSRTVPEEELDNLKKRKNKTANTVRAKTERDLASPDQPKGIVKWVAWVTLVYLILDISMTVLKHFCPASAKWFVGQ